MEEQHSSFALETFQGKEEEHLVDLLPYVDENLLQENSYDVDSLIKDELKGRKPRRQAFIESTSYSTGFSKTLAALELQRIEEGLPSEYEDPFSRYETKLLMETAREDVQAWNRIVQREKTVLEHDLLQLTNLELLKRYGSQSCLLVGNQLERIVQRQRKLIQQYKETLDEINIRRKRQQEVAYHKLQELDRKWKGLVEKNRQILEACNRLELEIEQLSNVS
eukprot:jgi/Galph1/1365/GphlegSOOS_G6104.1